jgi:amino acid permease
LNLVYHFLGNDDRSVVCSYIAVTLPIGLYLYVACFGYATFGDDTADSILTNYGDSDLTMLISRMAVSISLTLSAPLSLHPALSIIGRLQFGSWVPTGIVRRAIASSLMIAGAMLVALVVCSHLISLSYLQLFVTFVYVYQ